MAWISGWKYKKIITIPETQIDSDLSLHPVTVILNNSNFDFSKCKPDGSDIRFTDINLNPLKFERVEHKDGTYMQIATSTTGTDYLYFAKTGLITVGNVTVIEATLKVESAGSGLAQSMSVRDGTKMAAIGYKTSSIICNFGGTLPYTYAVDTSVYHKYTIKLNGTTNAEFLLDDVVIHTATYADLFTNASNFMHFGDGDGAVTYGGSVLWKSVRYNLNYGTQPNNFVEWNPTIGLPSVNGWTANGTVSLATIFLTFAKYNVLVPDISSTIDTKILIWYGNPNAYNNSIEAWQDKTGKQLTYNGNVKLAPTVVSSYDAISFADDCSATTGWTNTSGVGAFASNGSYLYATSYGTGAGAWHGVNLLKTLPQVFKGDFDFTANITFITTTAALGTLQIQLLDESSNLVAHFVLSDSWSDTAPNTSMSVLFGGQTVYSYNYQNINNNLTNVPMRIKRTGQTVEFSFNGSVLATVSTTTLSNISQIKIILNQYSNYDVSTMRIDNLSLTGYSSAEYGRSAYFDGNGDYFSLADSEDWSFGSGNFCIELIASRTVFNTYQTIFSNHDSSSNDSSASARMLYYTDNKVYCNVFVGATKYEFASIRTFTDSTPHHFAFLRDGAMLYLYIDGVLDNSLNISTLSINNSTQPFVIGRQGMYNDYYFTGYIFGMRITKGRPRYTITFTAPTKFDIDGSDVVFCTNFDTIYDQNYVMVQHTGITLVDATGNGNNATATGTTVIDTEFGKARRFNGTSDYITLTACQNASEGTIQLLVKPITAGSNKAFIIDDAGGYLTLGHHLSSPYNVWMGAYDSSSKSAVSGLTYTGAYHSFGGSYKNNSTVKLNIDGTTLLIGSSMTGNLGSVANALKLGKNGTSYTQMEVAKVSVSNIARSDAWIKAETLSVKNQLLQFDTEMMDVQSKFLIFF
jgi:hypothetical protein